MSDLLLSADPVKLADEAGALPSGRQRAVYEAFPDAFGDDWVEKIVCVFDRVGARGVTEIARILLDRGELPALVNHLRSAIARRDLGSDALIWVCRERKGRRRRGLQRRMSEPPFSILLENDHLSDGPRKTSRLQSLLGDDKKLLTDLVGIMDVNEARNFARRLLDCPVFGDLEKKSLMARIIKARPETGRTGERYQQPSVPRKPCSSHGKASERKRRNSTTSSATKSRRTPRTLTSPAPMATCVRTSNTSPPRTCRNTSAPPQRAGQEITRARGTDFKGSDAAKVNIGTIVTLTDSSGKDVEMTVLGAWDSDPDKKLVSYLSEVGKALVGRAPGESRRGA